jgi:sulfur carrier protein
MMIDLNGRRVELPSGATVADAVVQAGADDEVRGVAVAVDGEVVRKAEWVKTRLRPDQSVEVVRAVQGG